MGLDMIKKSFQTDKLYSPFIFLSSSSEAFVVFSGGLSYDKAGRRPTLTIMHGKAITVLEMDYPIVDFLVLCDTPYLNGEYAEWFSLLSSISLVLGGTFNQTE